MSKLDFLDGPEPAEIAAPEPQAEPAPEAPATEAAASGPERGPDGKFVSRASDGQAAPEPATTAAPEPTTPAPQPAEPGHVPLSAMLDEREKRQAAERRAEEQAERLRQFEAQQQQAPMHGPDPYEDPEGYAFNVRWQAVTSVSETMATQQHGSEVVQSAARAYLAQAAQKPWLMAELHQQPHPYEYVVQWQKREQMLSQLTPDDFAQFQAWKTSQAVPLNSTAQASPALPPTIVAPPPSINAAPGAGGVQHVPSGPGQAFGAIFS